MTKGYTTRIKPGDVITVTSLVGIIRIEIDKLSIKKAKLTIEAPQSYEIKKDLTKTNN